MASPGDSRGGRRDASPEWTENLVRWIGENLVLFLVVMVVSLAVLIALVLIVLSTIPQGGQERGRTASGRDTPLRYDLESAGVAYFWRMLGLEVLLLMISLGLAIALVALLTLAGWAIFSSMDSMGVIFLFVFFAVLLAITLFILVFVPVAIVGQLALRKLVLGGERILDSIRAALVLF